MPQPIPTRALHLWALWSLAVAQPLLDLLGRGPELFVARGHGPVDILLLVTAVVLLPLPLLAVAAWAGSRPRTGLLQPALVGLFAALVFLQAASRPLRSSVTLSVVGAIGAGLCCAVLYERWPPLRMLLTVLSPAPLVVAAVFLVGSPVRRLLSGGGAVATEAAGSATRVPIVVLVLDELPLVSLLDGDGGIDAVRYPAFARLAATSTWFRHAYSVHDDTTRAVPALVTGRYPRGDRLPIARDHPLSLFTLLATSHRMRVDEPVTRLCPPVLCGEVSRPPLAGRMVGLVSDLGLVYLHLTAPARLAARLPPVDRTWSPFVTADPAAERTAFERRLIGTVYQDDRARRFADFLEGLDATAEPGLHFLHLMLPHSPWIYLPSGRHYGGGAPPYGTVEGGRWSDRAALVHGAWQRHLLQVESTDRLLGALLGRLDEIGLFDPCLLLVVADHGISFAPGGDPRRLSRANAAEVATIPAFMKAPGQRSGRLEERAVELVDLLPTLATALGTALPWPIDGRSALEPDFPDRDAIQVFARAADRISSADPGPPLQLPVAALEDGFRAALERKLAVFGPGAKPLGLYRIGPFQELLGRPLEGLAIAPGAGPVTARLSAPEAFRDVDPGSGFVPAHVYGEVAGDERLPLAVAVNGRVFATTESFRFGGRTLFSAIVPERALRPGANRVGLYLIETEGEAVHRLVALAETAADDPPAR